MADATDVIRDIDQLRRDLSGYHGQLVAHNELQRHCGNQRRRIAELEGLYADAKAENAKLRGLLADVWNVCCQCNREGRELYKPALYGRLRELGVGVDE